MEGPVIIGNSQGMKALIVFIRVAAKSDANVLLLGETGVGKSLAARAIHLASPRRQKEFVQLNCGNIDENLAESELFGHRKGSFTGALADRSGLIETADGGTFFFDEIGDISAGLQAKILSVIEDKEVRRIGDHQFRKIDVRFMFATNKDLHGLMAKSKFRQDLYYRINILSFRIPPLRQRKEDIPLMVEFFLERESAKAGSTKAMSQEALDRIISYPLPGNIRELDSIIRRACEYSSDGVIREADVAPLLALNPALNSGKGHEWKKTGLLEALIACKGNKTQAAKRLRISRVHLYRLLRSLREKGEIS